MALFGPDPEKVERWKQEGKVSKLRSTIEGGGPCAEQAQQALVDIIADPSSMPLVTEDATLEAFQTLLNLDQHAASWAMLQYAQTAGAHAALACRMIDALASRRTDAALLATLRMAGSGLSGVGVHAVKALIGMEHPRLNEALRSAFLLAEREALVPLLGVLEVRQVPGASKVLVHRFPKLPADLRKRVARALHRQGMGAAHAGDAVLRTYLLVEEERYAEAASQLELAWQPLAEALGASPEPGDRTMRILHALAHVDRNRLYHALRLRLAKAVGEAETHADKETIAAARAAAAWILPALADIYGRTGDVREISMQLTADRFLAARSLLEAM
ncbi:MAG: hypothetical protein HY907_07790 [Deltaproteobacteria bacterium]|nr:hypothetical protein [Deltaproteobacteria bacterium]